MARETATAQSAVLAELQRDARAIDGRVDGLNARAGELAAAVDKSAAAAQQASEAVATLPPGLRPGPLRTIRLG